MAAPFGIVSGNLPGHDVGRLRLGRPGPESDRAGTEREPGDFQWIYVGADTTSRSWTVTMPTTAGQYEFRLYLNNGFVPQAISPAVTAIAP